MKQRQASARQGASAAAFAVLAVLAFPRALEDGPARPPLEDLRSATDRIPAIVVKAYEYGFEPTNLVVKVGLVVSWRAVGEEPHLVTPASKRAAWVFFRAKRKGTARHVFEQPGVYRYYCSLHPRMRGAVTVRR